MVRVVDVVHFVCAMYIGAPKWMNKYAIKSSEFLLGFVRAIVVFVYC